MPRNRGQAAESAERILEGRQTAADGKIMRATEDLGVLNSALTNLNSAINSMRNAIDRADQKSDKSS